jgi:predicted nucleic acid-binding protein
MKRRRVMAEVVIDASALVDLLLGGTLGDAVAARTSGHTLHGPAHIDAEVLSALGRLNRAGRLTPAGVHSMLQHLSAAPIIRHPVAELLVGAWARRTSLRLADALYVELASAVGVSLLTTDVRLKSVQLADVITS